MIKYGIKEVPYGLWRHLNLLKRHLGSFCRHNTVARLVNLTRLYGERWRDKVVLSAYPIEIIIDPTNMCHLRCPLCPTGQRVSSRQAGQMKFQVYQRIIDELGKWLYKVRFYNWGEPLGHADIYRMIEYASAKNIGTEISTHLNVFEESQAGTMIEAGLESLIISLDGAEPTSYSRYKVGGDFDRVIRNIAAIVAAKKQRGSKYPVIEIQFLVMGHNESQMEQMEGLARELGVDRLKFGPVIINTRNEKDYQWLPGEEKRSRYSYADKKDKIYSYRKKCEWLWRSAVINWDGTVAPCCVYEGDKAKLGRLGEGAFFEVWNNEYYQQSRAIFTKNGISDRGLKTICSHCKGVPEALDKDQHGLY